MTIETVSVLAGGRRYSFWETVTVQYGATQAVRAASLVTVDAATTFGGGWPLLPGTDVDIYAGGSLLIRGFVETFSPNVSDTSHTAVVTIVSKSKDAVEASADHPTGEIRNKRLVEIAREIDPTGTTWQGNAGESVALFRVQPGETVFDAVERTARGQGVLLVGRETGAVEIVRGIRGRHQGSIREGTPLGFVSG
jgi:prophage tail gpP-like protein